MAIPTSYDEAGLKAYLHAELGTMATGLEWTVDAGSYDEIVYDSLFRYGQIDIGEITGADNVRRLRCLAKVFVWRAVVKAVAGDFDFSADGASFSRSQIQTMAEKALRMAEDEAGPYLYDDDDDNRNAACITKVTHKHDPYQYVPDDERTL